VLTDVKMPGEMDGLDLAERIKTIWPAVPVLIASANGPERDISGFSEGFFLKPYDFNAVGQRIGGLLASSSGDVGR
jgi:CheY-like chemotaxis protein